MNEKIPTILSNADDDDSERKVCLKQTVKELYDLFIYYLQHRALISSENKFVRE